ncbi:MAG: hypothetical protein HC939_09095 [Pleurocapsa sp. SU_5_0]|nr:hypothetical protein [Pleurocapsa sp. SU_5_0]
MVRLLFIAIALFVRNAGPVVNFYQQRHCLTNIDGNLAVAEVASSLARSLEVLKTA